MKKTVFIGLLFAATYASQSFCMCSQLSRALLKNKVPLVVALQKRSFVTNKQKEWACPHNKECDTCPIVNESCKKQIRAKTEEKCAVVLKQELTKTYQGFAAFTVGSFVTLAGLTVLTLLF